LPKHLQTRARAGHFPLPQPVVEKPVAEKKSKASKAEAPVVEEAPVDTQEA